MSNQATNMGAEDVLSSIRKLVSNTSGSEQLPVAPRRPKKANKLVLTPALRVTEPVAETERRAPPERASAVPWTNPKTTLFEAAEAVIQPEVDALPAKPGPMLLRPEDAVPNDKVAWIRPEIARTNSQEDGPSADDFAFRRRGDKPTEAGTSADQPLSKKIEALEAAIGRTSDHWEPDGTTDEDYSGTKVEPAIAWKERGPEASGIEIAAGSVVEPRVDDPETRPDVSMHDKVQQHAEAAVTDATGMSEPRGETANQAAAEPAQEAPKESEAVLDEDSLRELVSEIVRQELQGVLGERITRNVRKLVRREIHRALTTRDLD